VGGVFFVLLLCLSCTDAEDGAATDGSELRIGVPEGIADGTEVGVGQLTRTIALEGLTQLSAEARAIPRLAESWAWENDERRLRIRLRQDITLHNGSRLDAKTAAEALAAVIAKGGTLASYPALADVRDVLPQGQFDLLLDLREPSPSLPVDLTVLLDIPAGPYRITRQDETVTTLDRFDRYYQGTPSIQRITIRSFDTLRTTWASLLRGELDMVYDVPADAVGFIRNDDIDVVSVPRWYQHVVAFNGHDARFKSPLVRKAMNMAVNRAAIIERVLHGAGAPSAGPIYPKYWSFDPTKPQYAFEPAEAAELLDAAGYPLRNTRTNDGPPSRFRFTCLLPKDFTVWQRIALEVQKSLFDVGIDMQFKVVPLSEFNELVSSRTFDAAFINLISGPTPSRPYMWWRSARAFKGPYNVFGYESAEAEEAFSTLLRSTNEAAIRSATSTLQQVFYDDPPAIFVAWDTRIRAVHRRFVLPDDGRDPMWSLWKWAVSPSKVASTQ
jgi:peptide/nickel transport system substrate-binding protein